MNFELSARTRVLAAAACALLLAPLLASGEEAVFQVSLTGPETGDPDGRGDATVTLNPETNEVEVRLSYSNIAEPTAMHIRVGATGLEGNVILPITIVSTDGETLVGRRKSAKPDVVAQIVAAPEEHYLVVITAEYPVGALRAPLRE